MKNIAHRGFSGEYPENTMIAFEKAIEIGADMLELDVTLSKDKIPVVIHDDTIDRTSNGIGFVKDYSLEKLRELDFGSWKNKKFSNEKIPTLEDVLRLIKKSSIHLNIEIKSSAHVKKFSKSCIELQVLNLINKYKLMNRIVISSFEPNVLLRLRKISSKIQLAFLIEPDYKTGEDPVLFVRKIKAVSLNMHKSQVGTHVYNESKKFNIPIYIYTVNTSKELEKLIRIGIEGAFTNFPNKLKILNIGKNTGV